MLSDSVFFQRYRGNNGGKESHERTGTPMAGVLHARAKGFSLLESYDLVDVLTEQGADPLPWLTVVDC